MFKCNLINEIKLYRNWSRIAIWIKAPHVEFAYPKIVIYFDVSLKCLFSIYFSHISVHFVFKLKNLHWLVCISAFVVLDEDLHAYEIRFASYTLLQLN